ncbi:hypothetical protein SESBI_39394 [Sesbania bispinosa]|nr:hypothetical protein SESBI_39394 [Sesbania bispinosa]
METPSDVTMEPKPPDHDPSQANIQSNKTNLDQAKEPLHGEWIVVTKARKKNSSRNKADQPSSSHIGPSKLSLKKSSDKAKLEGMPAQDTPTYGIQTAWNVDIILASRMRFRDVDDPSTEMGMDTVNDPPEKDLTSVSDEDMHEEDRTLKTKVNKSCPP